MARFALWFNYTPYAISYLPIRLYFSIAVGTIENMNRSEIIRYLILRSIGNFLVLFAIFGVVATFGPALYYEVSFRVAQYEGVKYTVEDPDQVKNPSSPLGELMRKEGKIRPPVRSGFGALLAGVKEQIIVPKDTKVSHMLEELFFRGIEAISISLLIPQTVGGM
jgi:hypothetical protein